MPFNNIFQIKNTQQEKLIFDRFNWFHHTATKNRIILYKNYQY